LAKPDPGPAIGNPRAGAAKAGLKSDPNPKAVIWRLSRDNPASPARDRSGSERAARPQGPSSQKNNGGGKRGNQDRARLTDSRESGTPRIGLMTHEPGILSQTTTENSPSLFAGTALACTIYNTLCVIIVTRRM
jgi:hypothetical protein